MPGGETIQAETKGKNMTAAIRRIDESRLETDLEYRFSYLAEFIGFGPDDIAVIHASAAHLAPLVDSLVDAVYVKLFSYDATKRHFVPRQHGYEGAVPVTLDELTLDHDQIKFRKAHLANYLKKIVTAPYDAKTATYLDFVGKIHTAKAGSPDILVPLVQMNVLMGFVSTAILATIQGLGVDQATKDKATLAFNKVLWIQNDLIVRWYAA